MEEIWYYGQNYGAMEKLLYFTENYGTWLAMEKHYVTMEKNYGNIVKYI